MNRFMRILVMFDLPVKTKAQRRSATQFRNFLVGDGYHMVQYSVYARVCNGRDSVETHRRRIMLALPPQGSVRMLVITEKQYGAIELLVGQPSPFDKPQQFRQLMFFRKSKKNDSFRNRSSCFVIGHFSRKNKRMKCPTRSFPWPNSRDYRNDGSSTNCCPKDYIFWRAHRRSVTPLCTPVPVQIQGSFQCQSLHRVGWINRQQHP